MDIIGGQLTNDVKSQPPFNRDIGERMNRRVILVWLCMALSCVNTIVGWFADSQDAHTRASIFLVGAMILNYLEKE